MENTEKPYTRAEAITDLHRSVAAWEAYKAAAEAAYEANSRPIDQRKVNRANHMIQRLSDHLDLLEGRTELYS